MKDLSKQQKNLLIVGWLLFWFSLFLPMNTSRGGLTDAGKSLVGFINLFYSVISIFALSSLFSNHKDLSELMINILLAGIGICNLLMIFGVPILIFTKKSYNLTKFVMTFCAVYSCTAGIAVGYYFRPILYGQFVWCLSFAIVAVALYVETKTQIHSAKISTYEI